MFFATMTPGTITDIEASYWVLETSSDVRRKASLVHTENDQQSSHDVHALMIIRDALLRTSILSLSGTLIPLIKFLRFKMPGKHYATSV